MTKQQLKWLKYCLIYELEQCNVDVRRASVSSISGLTYILVFVVYGDAVAVNNIRQKYNITNLSQVAILEL